MNRCIGVARVMVMCDAVRVDMDVIAMGVRSKSLRRYERASNSPGAICRAEGNHRPCCNAAASRFDAFHLSDRRAGCKADASEHGGAQYVGDSACGNDGQCPPDRPMLRTRKGDERDIVIGAEQRVDEADACGRDEHAQR